MSLRYRQFRALDECSVATASLDTLRKASAFATSKAEAAGWSIIHVDANLFAGHLSGVGQTNHPAPEAGAWHLPSQAANIPQLAHLGNTRAFSAAS